MADQQEDDQDPRLQAMNVLRGKAFAVGSSIGNVFSKTFELIMRVMDAGLEDEKLINYALESLEQERMLAMRHDGNGVNRIDELIFGLSDSVAVMIDGLMTKRRRELGIEPERPDSNADSNDNLPLLFGRVKQEVVEEPDIIMLEDEPSTSVKAEVRTKKAPNVVPASQSNGPSTSRQEAGRVQNAPNAVIASLLNGTSTGRQEAGSAQKPKLLLPVAAHYVHREGAREAPPANTKRVRQEPASPEKKPTIPQPVSSLDVRARADEEEGQSSGNTGPPKRRRTLVHYGEDNHNEEWEQLIVPSAPVASVGRRAKFQCEHCDKSFPSIQGLRCHGKVHDGIQCTMCKYRMRPEAMAKHMATKHAYALVLAPVEAAPAAPTATPAAKPQQIIVDPKYSDADIEGIDVAAADAEGAATSAYGSWVCDRCDGAFSSSAALDKHYYMHTGRQCRVCSKYVRKELIEAHMQRIHGGDAFKAPLPVSPPKEARRSFPTSSAHDAAHYRGDTEDDEEGEEAWEDDDEYRPAGVARGVRASSVAAAAPGAFACAQCDKTFNTHRGLAKHAHAHAEGGDTRERFLCEICSAARLSMSMLNHHRRTAHGINPYECDCGQTFDKKSPLLEHMRRFGHAKSANSRMSAQPEGPETSRAQGAEADYI